jgi:hypothetical protein
MIINQLAMIQVYILVCETNQLSIQAKTWQLVARLAKNDDHPHENSKGESMESIDLMNCVELRKYSHSMKIQME